MMSDKYKVVLDRYVLGPDGRRAEFDTSSNAEFVCDRFNDGHANPSNYVWRDWPDRYHVEGNCVVDYNGRRARFDLEAFARIACDQFNSGERKASDYAWESNECISETPPNGHDEQPACPICSKRAARMKRLPQWFHDLADLVDTSDDWVCENPDAIHRVLEHLDYSVREDLVGCLVDMVEELKKTT